MWWMAAAYAQEPYWRMKDRLLRDFMVVGPEMGQSMPATRRVDGSSMKWSDATIEYGWYLGALAIEERLLADELVPGFDEGGARSAEASAAELALAVAVLDRIDAHPAEAFPDCAGPWELDGFFVRDDVPSGFNENFSGIGGMESDWIDPVLTNKEMSQDQVMHLLLGIAMVAKYTDPTLEIDGVAIRERAVAAAARIGAHVAADGDWVIRNPGCEDRDVDRGDAAQFYSTPIAATVEWITGSAPAEGLYPEAWDESAYAEYPAWDNTNNLHMAMALAAAGDAWGEDTWGRLVDLAEVNSWEAYPAAWAALHGPPDEGELLALGDRLDAQLAAMGEDQEPASPWPAVTNHSFTTWNRYITPIEDSYGGQDDTSGHRYPGVDFLLARALQLALFEADWPADVEEEGGGGEESCGCRSADPGAPLILALLALRRRRA